MLWCRYNRQSSNRMWNKSLTVRQHVAGEREGEERQGEDGDHEGEELDEDVSVVALKKRGGILEYAGEEHAMAMIVPHRGIWFGSSVRADTEPAVVPVVVVAMFQWCR